MASTGPAPKILFVLDLDYTHFNSHKGIPTWLGPENDWVAFYNMCHQVAANRGVELLFSVVTSKPTFDDIADTAAKTFKHLLSFNNPAMYRHFRSLNWCLVRHEHQLRYECLSMEISTPCHFTNVISHFVATNFKDKSPFIKEIADFYQIPHQNCLVLDDTPKVLLDVTNSGMRTVGFEAFNPDSIDDIRLLDQPRYVQPILQAKRREIWNTLESMLNNVTAQIPSDITKTSKSKISRTYDHAYVSEELLQAIHELDPPDCLYSWGSFRIFHGNPSFIPKQPTEPEAASSSTVKRSL